MLSPGMIYDDDETLLRSKRHNAYHLALRVGCTFRPLHSTRNVRGTHEYLRLVGLRERRVTTTCHHGQYTEDDNFVLHGSPSSFVKTCLANEYRFQPDDVCDTYVNLSLELLNGLDTTRGCDDLATTDLLALDTTEQGTHVVTRLTLTKVSTPESSVLQTTYAVELLVKRLCAVVNKRVVRGFYDLPTLVTVVLSLSP